MAWLHVSHMMSLSACMVQVGGHAWRRCRFSLDRCRCRCFLLLWSRRCLCRCSALCRSEKAAQGSAARGEAGQGRGRTESENFAENATIILRDVHIRLSSIGVHPNVASAPVRGGHLHQRSSTSAKGVLRSFNNSGYVRLEAEVKGSGIERKVLLECPDGDALACLWARHKEGVGMRHVVLPLHTVKHRGLLRHVRCAAQTPSSCAALERSSRSMTRPENNEAVFNKAFN